MSKDTEAKIAEAIENTMEIFDPLDPLLDEVAEDPGAPFRPEFLAELADLKHEDEAAYDAKLSKLKDAGVQIGTLDKAIIDILKVDKPALTQADVILRIADEFELFHSADMTAYADVYVERRRETYPIASKTFEQRLKQRFYMTTSEAATPEAIRKVKDLLEARAQFEGPMREVCVRVANADEALYIDLCNENWDAVEIRPDGWQVVQNPPVRFCRFSGMLPLPVPERGSLDTLRPYFNASRDVDFVLLVLWIVAALRHGGPYPVLVLSGAHGTAKSTTSDILRELVDPNSASIRAIPHEERDLFIAAKHSHVLAFDNLSSVPQWLSDSLCRLATGGGHATRKYYTDEEEVLSDAQRPVILNGIEQVVTRADLADRAIFIQLEPISPERRLSEHELWANFEKDRAPIFGALLQMMVQGLRTLPEIKPRKLPRMADFALWAMACEGAEWRGGTFEQAYSRNREETVESVVDSDPVASAVQELTARAMQTMRTHDSPHGRVYEVWAGTASELLSELLTIAIGNMEKDRNWPRTAKELSNRLARATPFLRERGIEITRKQEGHDRRRMIYITLIGNDVDRSSAPSASSASRVRDTDTDKSTHNANPVIEEQLSVEVEELPTRPPGKIVVKLPKKRPANT